MSLEFPIYTGSLPLKDCRLIAQTVSILLSNLYDTIDVSEKVMKAVPQLSTAAPMPSNLQF